ncbi:MAG: ATP synthase F1 subunit delta [Clostridia bacterium]|nr:ATP synthase F1 subunit delta [Clostridia bacterium]
MTGLAKEYGEGLYELARDERLLDELHGELTEIAALLDDQPDFVRLLCSRAIERDRRLQVVDETFRDRAHAYVVNYMKLLVEKERFECFLDSVRWFHQRYNEDFGIVEAHVTSAVALSDDDQAALRQKLQEMSKKQVSLITRVDPALIGGIRVEMDGKRYDNTIQNKLSRLRQSLVQGL